MAARNKHFEKNTQTFSQKGSSLLKAVQIKEAARLLEELKAAESGEETLPLDGAEWLGWLRIPSLELELPVQAEWGYPALKTSPCRYAGTPETGLVFAAHNYEQHFARLSLLTAGDAVEFTDVPVYRDAGGDAGPHRRG